MKTIKDIFSKIIKFILKLGDDLSIRRPGIFFYYNFSYTIQYVCTFNNQTVHQYRHKLNIAHNKSSFALRQSARFLRKQ